MEPEKGMPYSAMERILRRSNSYSIWWREFTSHFPVFGKTFHRLGIGASSLMEPDHLSKMEIGLAVSLVVGGIGFAHCEIMDYITTMIP